MSKSSRVSRANLREYQHSTLPEEPSSKITLLSFWGARGDAKSAADDATRWMLSVATVWRIMRRFTRGTSASEISTAETAASRHARFGLEQHARKGARRGRNSMARLPDRFWFPTSAVEQRLPEARLLSPSRACRNDESSLRVPNGQGQSMP
jgi:hypothetical protein